MAVIGKRRFFGSASWSQPRIMTPTLEPLLYIVQNNLEGYSYLPESFTEATGL